MDLGEYGFGVLGTTMMIESDCPSYATFMNATLVASNGAVVVVDKALCLFERPSAVQAWRHTEAFSAGFANARSQVEFVVRMIATVVSLLPQLALLKYSPLPLSLFKTHAIGLRMIRGVL